MIDHEEGVKATTETSEHADAGAPDPEVKTMNRKEKVRRWLIIIGSVILAIFLVYLLLILAYPSMNIGMNP